MSLIFGRNIFTWNFAFKVTLGLIFPKNIPLKFRKIPQFFSIMQLLNLCEDQTKRRPIKGGPDYKMAKITFRYRSIQHLIFVSKKLKTACKIYIKVEFTRYTILFT